MPVIDFGNFPNWAFRNFECIIWKKVLIIMPTFWTKACKIIMSQDSFITRVKKLKKIFKIKKKTKQTLWEKHCLM